MTVLRPRNRLISFRLSEAEYEALYNLTLAAGARSVSDFARKALSQVLQENGTSENPMNSARAVGDAATELIVRLNELSRVIGQLSQQLSGDRAIPVSPALVESSQNS